MKFKTNFLNRYLRTAPIPLAVERTLECVLHSKKDFARPILDVGCGEGLFAQMLFDEQIDVGIDPDERELLRAKELGMYTELIKCFGDKIPKPSSSFNTILSNSVMEHIPDIEPVLKEINRLLTAEGNFYVTLPTNLFDNYSIINQFLTGIGLKHQAAKFRTFFNSFWRHYHYYDLAGWKAMFERNGFYIVEHREYAGKSLCLFDDFMTPLSIPSLILKKTMNKWVLFPFLRPLITLPVKLFIRESNVEKFLTTERGGLIYFHLKKR
jgi:SAM-dependent methyltransferase